MTDEERGRRGKERKKTPPSLTLSFGPIVKAKDNTFSTRIRVVLSGWWEGGFPKEAELYLDDQPANVLEIRDREVAFPLTGLEPENHHVIAVRIRERWAKDLLTVPALPKPKSKEEAALETERTELERARVASEIAELTDLKTPVGIGKKLYVTYIGRPGRQRLTITVGDINGNAIPNFPLVIVDGEEAKTVKTSPEGAFIHQLDFQGHSHYVEVRAGVERDLIWRAGLIGPAPRPRRQT